MSKNIDESDLGTQKTQTKEKEKTFNETFVKQNKFSMRALV